MRPTSRLGTLALLLISAAPVAAAQKASATATIVTAVQQAPATVCDQAAGPLAHANATCAPQAVRGGTAGASADANLFTQTVAVAVGMLDKGTPGIVASADAEGRITGKIFVNGVAESGDYLVLHFLAALDYQFSGRPQDVFSALVTAAHGEGDAGASYFRDIYSGSHGNTSDANGAHRAAGGFDLILGFDNFTGPYSYTYGAGLAMALNDDLTGIGTAQFGIRLTGIDAYDVDNQYLNSVVVDRNGVERLDLMPADEEPPTEIAPEPATFVLSGTGLVCILGVARRRRRRTE